MRLLRFGAVCALIVWFMLRAWVIKLTTRDVWARRRRLAAIMAAHAQRVCGALGIVVVLEGRARTRPGSYMVVANHMSYLDVLAVAAALPGCFVTSMEVRDTPLLGDICRLGGCLFVERRRKDTLCGEVREAARALERGLNVIAFPEATSTDGSAMRPFRAGLFRAALLAERPVLPVALNYERIDGQPVTPRNRDVVMWYGDMTFVPHLWRLAGVRRVVARLSVLEPLQGGPGFGARELAQASQEAIAERFVPVGYRRPVLA